MFIYFITISRSRPSEKDSSCKHLRSVIIYSPSRHPNLPTLILLNYSQAHVSVCGACNLKLMLVKMDQS